MYIYILLILVNLIGFIVMGVDKQKARRGKWRVKESTIWLIAIIGGAMGTTLGMWMFRHKTKHLSFKLGLPFLSIVHIIIFGYVIERVIS